MKKILVLLVMAFSLTCANAQSFSDSENVELFSTMLENYVSDNCRAYVVTTIGEESDNLKVPIKRVLLSSSMSKDNVIERIKTYYRKYSDVSILINWRMTDEGFLSAAYSLPDNIIQAVVLSDKENCYNSNILISTTIHK